MPIIIKIIIKKKNNEKRRIVSKREVFIFSIVNGGFFLTPEPPRAYATVQRYRQRTLGFDSDSGQTRVENRVKPE